MTEAGWYEDPEQHGRGRRYWDGSQWTEHYENPATGQQAAAPQAAQTPAQDLPPAGWKDDPEGGPGMRYWDGKEWTDHYHPPREPSTGQQAAAAPASTPPSFQETPAKSSSLDETQLDVRGFHAGQETPAADPAPAAPASEPEPVSEPEPEPAAAESEPAPAEDDIPGRLKAIEDQLALLSEKAGVPYNR